MDHSGRRSLLLTVALAALVLAVYAQTFRHDFVEYDDPAYVSAAGSAADGTTVTFPVGPDTAKGKEFDTFKAAYKAQTGKDLATYSIYEHDAFWMLKLAIEKVHSTKPAEINKALHEVNYQGITGAIKFNDKGDRQAASIVAFKVQNGQFVPTYILKGTDWASFS